MKAAYGNRKKTAVAVASWDDRDLPNSALSRLRWSPRANGRSSWRSTLAAGIRVSYRW